MKYYAVRKGRKTGVFTSWEECRAQVHGCSGAIYKSFPTLEQAQAFLEESSSADSSYAVINTANSSSNSAKPSAACSDSGAAEAGAASDGADMCADPAHITQALQPGEMAAYVDGSYNVKTGVYGSGAVLIEPSGVTDYAAAGADPALAVMRNVAGEILGAQAAVDYALQKGYRKVDVYYDYAGVEMWATGGWKANKPGTAAYQAWFAGICDKIEVSFHKVAAHTGVEFNERADRLAKQAAGIGAEPDDSAEA